MLSKFLQRLTIWSNAELGLLKACLICFGISAGIFFYDLLQVYLNYIFVMFVIMAAWTLFLWIKKMKELKEEI